MKTNLRKFLIPFICGLILFAGSCTTVRANYFLLTDLTNAEKADLLFKKTVNQYNDELIKKREFAQAKKIRTAFNDVLNLDPSHPQAEKYIAETDKLIADTMSKYLSGAEKLVSASKRSEAQNLELLKTIQLADTLDSSNPRVKELKQEFAEMKRLNLEARVARLRTIEPTLLAESSQTEFQKKLKTAHAVILEIQTIEPKNKETLDIQKEISLKASEFASKDIEIAEANLKTKKYQDAENAIIRAEKTLLSISKEPNPKIQDLKYRIYYQWAVSEYSAKRYQSASDQTNQALEVTRTSEALALKTKIHKSASERNYDDEIKEILASIDAQISRENAAAALSAIETNNARMKKAANKAALEERRTAAYKIIDKIYKEGVALYAEEDYESAIVKFKLVVSADPNYEQVGSYIDKANTKVRALSGSN